MASWREELWRTGDDVLLKSTAHDLHQTPSFTDSLLSVPDRKNNRMIHYGKTAMQSMRIFLLFFLLICLHPGDSEDVAESDESVEDLLPDILIDCAHEYPWNYGNAPTCEEAEYRIGSREESSSIVLIDFRVFDVGNPCPEDRYVKDWTPPERTLKC